MSEITKAIQILCDDKGLNYETVLEALESALGAAYRKDFGNRQQNIQVKYDPETGDMKVWDEKLVVIDIAVEELEQAQNELNERREQARKENRELSDEEVADLAQFNPKSEIMVTEARVTKSDAQVGETLIIPLQVPGDFGRMAAQTAKQVIIQKLREAERLTVMDDFKKQQGSIVFGFVQRFDKNGSLIVDLGKVTGLVLPADQIRREHYKMGARLKFFVVSVDMGMRGPEIILSRTDKRMVQTVFEQEIPEVGNGDVEIKGIARDAGNRSKVAVYTTDDNVDPIGACIGQRGSRITTVIDELGGEKIDVIQYNDDPIGYIKNALSPAKITEVVLNEKTKEALARVQPDQFSLAIGREGQNVRLATDLTGWRITVEQIGGDTPVVGGEPVNEPVNENEPKDN
ncbi:MAG: transcription termination factor NusA [Candidatus Magasanikbacteria bacterium RIFCSPHIGHO2_01_FULL_41_23]|uniref:Transcription termination/antitermination protein NusA n=1 Tax=Candidatus Magasanikbacteria bacterium RIFCSPLOWO2_01_FULL_40_15 TaxID=1798686 RepID=A0A1F6N3Z5_9BACT|nr:MAG: transcription termination factor NusA [Candidatus Magasanikbacteria bacterium RIFCSPHIGHO2_01_FULL_41_23]OGH67179.1 MAG: transcription termination factor NusA [Candidatus Magasanikbacteria bacterium RIFCSPHIGHO2_02_FULL_41_35]OGH75456.1 MAG: transcription termination factor NusA [Candidatus Magasanikbacteria bacterium RIFCSPHIGHO2_12_FULL_41_16]OGH78716.1 MAG: transcription termination factor NusA [Candidatus Magasanikbacteria bacterium RIFCSPLOWO2_01_FULL_40_15]